MKMTKDDDTWSPEFWQASGSLGIDLNGLDISGTVDAAYYRAGAEVPGSVLTLPEIGSSNVIDGSTTDDQIETTDTNQPVDSTDDTGSTPSIPLNKLILQKTPPHLKLKQQILMRLPTPTNSPVKLTLLQGKQPDQQILRRMHQLTRRQKLQTQLTRLLRTRPLMSTPSSHQAPLK